MRDLRLPEIKRLPALGGLRSAVGIIAVLTSMRSDKDVATFWIGFGCCLVGGIVMALFGL